MAALSKAINDGMKFHAQNMVSSREESEKGYHQTRKLFLFLLRTIALKDLLGDALPVLTVQKENKMYYHFTLIFPGGSKVSATVKAKTALEAINKLSKRYPTAIVYAF